MSNKFGFVKVSIFIITVFVFFAPKITRATFVPTSTNPSHIYDVLNGNNFDISDPEHGYINGLQTQEMPACDENNWQYSPYYSSVGWPAGVSAFDESKYIEFSYPNLNFSTSTKIRNVKIYANYYLDYFLASGTKFEIYDGEKYVSFPTPTPIHYGCGSGILATIDASSTLFKPDQFNNLKIRFLVYRGAPLKSYYRVITDNEYLNVAFDYEIPHDPPVADMINLQSNFVDSSFKINLTGTSTYGNPLTFNVVKNPSKGDLSSTSTDGQITYNPHGKELGSDSFDFVAYDGTSYSATSTVNINLVAGTTTSFSFISDAVTSTVGSSTLLKVSARDQFGNLVSSDNSTVINFSSDTGTTTDQSIMLNAGEATTTGTSATSGIITFTAGNNSTTTSISVNFVNLAPVPPSNPIASILPGTYNSPQSVTFSNSENSDIYYTTNGATSTCLTSNKYNNAILIDSSETINAIACDNFGQSSGVVTFVYVINNIPAPVYSSGGGGGSYYAPSIQITTSTALYGDLNNDGKIDIFDINIVFAHWGENYKPADFNNDATVDIFDFNYLMAHWSI